MRRRVIRVPALLGVAMVAGAVAAVACATSSPIQQSTGGAGSGGGTFTSTDGGVRSCGLQADDPACNSCMEARCCSEALGCSNDMRCLGCLQGGGSSETCDLDQTFVAFRGCMQGACGAPCNLITPSTGAGGSTAVTSSGGGSPATSSTAASSSSSAVASSSSSSASTSAGATSSTSASSSSTGGPTTCDGADGNVGCCDSSGILWYCDATQDLVEQPCSGGAVCGWNDFFGYYDCVPPPGGPDPSQTYPEACGP